MSKGKFELPLSERLRREASHEDERRRQHQRTFGLILEKAAGGPVAAMLREAADLAERYESAERGVWDWKKRGLVEFEPSASYYNGMRFRLVPDWED